MSVASFAISCPCTLKTWSATKRGAFVKEHLGDCPACAAELAAWKAGARVEQAGGEMRLPCEAEAIKSMEATRETHRKRSCRVAAVIAGVFIFACALLHYFPVYRIADIGPMAYGGYYSGEQLAKAIYIGSASDRRAAQAVLRLADQAFGTPALKTKNGTACSPGTPPRRTAMAIRRSMHTRWSCGPPISGRTRAISGSVIRPKHSVATAASPTAAGTFPLFGRWSGMPAANGRSFKSASTRERAAGAAR